MFLPEFYYVKKVICVSDSFTITLIFEFNEKVR